MRLKKLCPIKFGEESGKTLQSRFFFQLNRPFTWVLDSKKSFIGPYLRTNYAQNQKDTFAAVHIIS